MSTHAITEQEQVAIEQLKQAYDVAWHQFVETFVPLLQPKLLKFTDGDNDKVQDYLSEIFWLIVQALGQMPKQEQAAIERLKQWIANSAPDEGVVWSDFTKALVPPLQRRLLEFTNGDGEKAEEYMTKILLQVGRALARMNKWV